MTASAFFGCALTAYGPPLALFVVTIAKDPVRIIILILSAFFWLLSLLLSSLLWFAVIPLKSELAFGLVFSVIFQETFRLLIYFLLRRADTWMKKLTENEHTQIFANRHILAYVVGLGFGLMSGAFSLVNVLADSLGPGTVGFRGEPQHFFMVSSVYCLIMIFLHTFWGIIAFDSLDKRRWLNLIFVFGSHMTVSCLSLLNNQRLYAATVLPSAGVLVLTATYSFVVVGGSWTGLLTCLRTPSGIWKGRTPAIEVPVDN